MPHHPGCGRICDVRSPRPSCRATPVRSTARPPLQWMMALGLPVVREESNGRRGVLRCGDLCEQFTPTAVVGPAGTLEIGHCHYFANTWQGVEQGRPPRPSDQSACPGGRIHRRRSAPVAPPRQTGLVRRSIRRTSRCILMWLGPVEYIATQSSRQPWPRERAFGPWR